MPGESGGDYDPGPWKGWDFKSARASYDASAGRSYSSLPATGKGTGPVTTKKLEDLVPRLLKTDSPSPVIIAVDVTGSMKDWPKIIFEKLPVVDLGLKDYLDKPEVSFMAIGDCYSDRYPLQVQPFGSGKDLADRVAALIPEGGGGGSLQESYDLAAVYAAHHVQMPKAVRPIFIYIGDEGLYPMVDPDKARTWARTDIEGKLKSQDALKMLRKRFSTYCIRKLYDHGTGDGMSETDKGIHKQWEEYLGPGRVAILNEPRRVVDVILGLVAYDTGNMDSFRTELTGRQTPEQVKTVMKSLKAIGTGDPLALPDPGKSVTKKSGDGKKSKALD
jgi:hypothetical protein